MQEARIAVGDDRLRLPVGTLLDGVYEIEGEIGAGGFGITYVARDRALGFKVAIKEYFPAEVGSRDSTMSVQPTTNGQKRVFDWGRSGFLNEARMLATLSHPNIVRVLRFFEANNTAYMVLEFEQGTSFAKWLDSLGRPPTQAELDRIARPLVEAIGAIHARKLVHRDIAPDNIIIRPDGSPVLLDFGAARHDVAEATRAAQSPQHSGTFAVIKRHYSPIEQHSTDTRNRGAWSDVYAVGGTFYRAVTGRAPTDAQDRLAADADPLVPARKAARGDYRLTFLDAIDEALRLKRHARPQSMPALAQMMFGEAAVSPHDRPPAKGGAASGSGKDEAEVPTVTSGKYPSADPPPAVGKRPS